MTKDHFRSPLIRTINYLNSFKTPTLYDENVTFVGLTSSLWSLVINLKPSFITSKISEFFKRKTLQFLNSVADIKRACHYRDDFSAKLFELEYAD